jgi:hypothetical protein
MEPRKVIGTIDTSEFLVAIAASIGFLIGIQDEGVSAGPVLALLAGGVIAAPLAAFIVRHLPPRILGSAVGGLIILTNARTIIRAEPFEARGWGEGLPLLIIALIWSGAIAWSIRAHRRDKAAAAATSVPVA